MEQSNPNTAAWPSNPAFDDRSPREGMDRVKGAAAQALHAAADMLRQRAEGASGQFSALTGYGQQASDFLARSAHFVEEMDMERMKRQMEDAVRRNPGRSLLIAGTVGLLLGATLRRR
ncbi:MAG TPA: DUF883 C-terminal domain-containing protein [Candidatus Polarisedimenticolaceae bacterium]|nr:DUF883 C-terminal domain-containing protein [Candidatus Polarisedimenticolaceae bacterium]